jgi:serine/threonine-protein kinase
LGQPEHDGGGAPAAAPRPAPSPGADLAPSGWEGLLREGAVVDRFELVREIGRGGFGVVWEARDREQGRAVAFKAVLGGDASDPRQERLLQEAEAAARLSHPNVVAFHEVGRTAHGPYLVLELLRGATLGQRLHAGPLAAREALRVAVEMAKGLAHAHAQGIFHRDVKPGNVFLCDDGAVKLLDLGMARTFGHRKIDGGTPAFMAPEQWRGAPEDERTDVFALGVVLFLMLARELPFPHDDDGAAVCGPRPAPGLDVPGVPALGALVARMLAKDPVARPRDAGEVLAALLGVQEELARTPALEPVGRVLRPALWRTAADSPRALAAGGAVLAVLGLGAIAGFALARPGAVLPLAGGLAVLAALALGALAVTRDRAPRRAVAAASPAGTPPPGADAQAAPATPSIAVLPFADLSPGRDQEHFSDGVAEEILNALAHVEGLRVAGRTSSFRFKGKTDDVRAIGRVLGVGAVVEGTVRTDGSRVRITAQVTNVADGLSLWSETYDRELTGVFAVQDEIARAVTAALRVKLLPGHEPKAAGARTTSPEAYGHYLRGRQLHNRGTLEGFRDAAAAHEQALALDPAYAPAWAGLAIALAMLWSAAGDEETAGVPELRRRALEAADRAVGLDPRLPDGHAVRATLRAMTFDWRGAAADIEEALALDPGDVRALRTQGWLLAAHGRIAESIDCERRAGELDPLNPAGWVNLAARQLALGDLAAAREAIELAREVAPAGQPAGRAQALVAHLLAGEGAAALATAEELSDERARLWGSALAHHVLGHERVAARTAEALAARFGERLAYAVAQVHAFRGDADEAFAWLDQSFDRREVALESIQFDALVKPLHADPRYRALLQRMRLVEDGADPLARLATPVPGAAARKTASALPAQPAPAAPAAAPPPAAGPATRELSVRLQGGQAAAARLALSDAAERLRRERARAGGTSGQTMHILADAVAEVHRETALSTGRRWRKVVAVVAGVGLVTAAVLGAIVLQQRRELRALLAETDRIDREIEQVQAAMAKEADADRLVELEGRLAELTGTARSKIREVASKDGDAARELAERGDDLDRAIRRILIKFDAQTYAVPPVFKSALKAQVDTLAKASNLKYVWARRNRYWPAISREFAALGLPEEMAYIAWAETQFDPALVSPAGAKGMWQMTAGTARELGLRVEGKIDERLDVQKQTRAAARKLANLLAEFGADSFMLALASYNRGEAGVRRVLHQIAQEKGGFRKEKRDFWHLYRMKRLPAETMDYVPRVLAAAVVCGDPQRYGLEAQPAAKP